MTTKQKAGKFKVASAKELQRQALAAPLSKHDAVSGDDFGELTAQELLSYSAGGQHKRDVRGCISDVFAIVRGERGPAALAAFSGTLQRGMIGRKATGKSYAGIPAKHRADVSVYMSVRNGLGENLSPQQAWAEMKARRLAEAQTVADRKAEQAAKRKAMLKDAAENLNEYSTQLAGVSDILSAIIGESGDFANAAGLARDAAESISSYLSELAGALR